MLAETRAQAKDAAGLVEVEYDPLPAVDRPRGARRRADLHDDLGTNHCFTWKLEGGDVEGVFGNAAVTVKERFRQQRLIPNAIEPRGVIAQYLPEEYTLWSATQIRTSASGSPSSSASRGAPAGDSPTSAAASARS